MNPESTSAFDKLVEYAKEKGFEFESHQNDRRLFFVRNESIHTKYVIFKKENLVFFAYDSYGIKTGSSITFSGLYGVIDLPEDFECFMYKKDWADSFLRVHKRKIGLKSIDEQITITSNSENIPQYLLYQKDAELFQDISKKIFPIKLLIQNDYLHNVEEYKGKKIIGIEFDGWLFKKEDLDVMMSLGEELLTNIISNCLKK
jgi:hypothetical protein